MTRKKFRFKGKRTKLPTYRIKPVSTVWQKHWICLVQLFKRSCRMSSCIIRTTFNFCRTCFHIISRLESRDTGSHSISFSLVALMLIQHGLEITSEQMKCSYIQNPCSVLQIPLQSTKVMTSWGISFPHNLLSPVLFPGINCWRPVRCSICIVFTEKILPDL